jgi:hypothetical protein
MTPRRRASRANLPPVPHLRRKSRDAQLVTLALHEAERRLGDRLDELVAALDRRFIGIEKYLGIGTPAGEASLLLAAQREVYRLRSICELEAEVRRLRNALPPWEVVP